MAAFLSTLALMVNHLYEDPISGVNLYGKNPDDIATRVQTFAPPQEVLQTINGGSIVVNPKDYEWNVKVSNSCQGTHIWPGVVLTSAKCVANGLPTSVKIGAIDMEDGVTAVVKEGFFYPGFINDYPWYNDIALLILDIGIESELFTMDLMPVNSDLNYPDAGAIMTMVSYGNTDIFDPDGPTGPTEPVILTDDENLERLSGFEVLLNAECELEWEQIGDVAALGTNLIDTNKQMCAATPGNTGACGEFGFGLQNMGAPLYDSQYRQVGVLSWGDCGLTADRSDVFTRTAPYYPWIFQMLCMTAPGGNQPKGCVKMLEPKKCVFFCGFKERMGKWWTKGKEWNSYRQGVRGRVRA